MNYQTDEKTFEEINLSHYANFIFKRKKQFLILFLIGGSAGALFTFLTPEKNRGETIIKLGGGLSKKYIETPVEVNTKIRESIYGKYQGIEVSRIEDSELLKIRIVSSVPPSEIKNALLEINESIIKKHNEILEGSKGVYNKKITDLEKMIVLQKAESREIENLRWGILNLTYERDNLMPTKVFLEPVVYESQKALVSYFLNFILGAILGFFLLLIYLIFLEWWLKNKAEIIK